MPPGGKSFITWNYLLTNGPSNFKPIGIHVSVILNLRIRAVKIPQVTFLAEAVSSHNLLLLVGFIGELREMLTGWSIISKQ